MNERAPKNSHESLEPSAESKQTSHEQNEALRQHLEKAAEAHKKHTHEDIAKISREIEHKAKTSEELKHNLETVATEHKTSDRFSYDSPQALPRALAQARKQLKPTERAFSKVVHNPKIESISAVGGATVARPSGMLYGALFSLIGSLTFYWISRKYGYEYNAFVGILSFVGGFFFGLIVEMVLRVARPARK